MLIKREQRFANDESSPTIGLQQAQKIPDHCPHHKNKPTDNSNVNFCGPSHSRSSCTTRRPWFAICKWFAICIVFLSISAVTSISFSTLYTEWINSEAPRKGLATFAASEISKGNAVATPDLKLDRMNVFSLATCVEGKSSASVQGNLRKQMKGLTEVVREDIISSAVLEETSTQSALQDVKTDLVDNGKAHSYLAYWKTIYSGERVTIGSSYNTCIVVASVEIEAAEDLAGYDVREEKIKIGSSPCYCGVLYCETCPNYAPRVTKTPIFKRHALSVKEQDNLHKWMTKEAVDSVIGILGQQVYNTAIDMKDQEQSWEGPNRNVYIS